MIREYHDNGFKSSMNGNVLHVTVQCIPALNGMVLQLCLVIKLQVLIVTRTQKVNENRATSELSFPLCSAIFAAHF